MINGINDEVILAARLRLATLFLIFGCRKVRDYSGTVSQMVQGWPPDAGTRYRRIDLHGTSGCVRGRRRRVHTSLGRTPGSILARNCACWASLLDSERCRLCRQPGGFLQRPQRYGRLLAVVDHRCGKIFDRCIVWNRRTITCGLSHERGNTTSREDEIACDLKANRSASASPRPRVLLSSYL